MSIAAGLVLTASASAEDATELVRLEYSAGPDCPGRSTFEARVLARTAKARFVEQGDTRTFEVSMYGGTSASGMLTVHRGNSIEGVRRVAGESCAEVAEGLALVVALAIDPTALGRATPSATATSSDVPVTGDVATTTAPSEQPASATPAPRSASAFPAAEPGLSAGHDAAPAAHVQRTPHTLFLGVDASIAGGVSPTSLVAITPLVGWRASIHGWLAPSVRASLAEASSGAVGAQEGSALFSWTVGRVDGCLFGWPQERAHLLACARLEAGVLGATTTGIPGARSVDRGWAAAGPLVRGEWELLGPLFVEVDVASLLRLTTDRFFILPDATIYRVPILGLEADGGVGVHFL